MDQCIKKEGNPDGEDYTVRFYFRTRNAFFPEDFLSFLALTGQKKSKSFCASID